jgi:hypothetical protein
LVGRVGGGEQTPPLSSPAPPRVEVGQQLATPAPAWS